MGNWFSTTYEEEPKETRVNIAAIDFGTTSVSLAYTTKGDNKVSTLILDEEEKRTRVSNALLFKKTSSSGDKILFGDIARTQFVRLRRTDLSDHVIIYFERIKMLLEKNKLISRNITVESFTGECFYLVEVIAVILKYLKDLLINHLSRGATPLRTTDFDWVITVPAIWDARGKRMMREAAYMAGLLTESGGITSFTHVLQPLPPPEDVNPDKLSLALEPEVAALYSQEVVIEKSARNPSAAVLHQRPTHYMVIDIGGGTVDITVHIERDGGIVVESIPTGNDWGGTQVNEAFSKMLQDIVSDPEFKRFLQHCEDDNTKYAKHMAAVNEIVYVNFEKQKKLFGLGRIEKEIAVDLSKPFIKFYDLVLKTGVKSVESVSYDDDILYIHKDIVESKLFGRTLDGIVSCIQKVIKESTFKVDTYYLVGGFGGCEYMLKKVKASIEHFCHKEGYPHHECNVIVPESPNLAVATGAVMWRKNPEIVKARPVDATYGIGIVKPFDPLEHDEHYCFYHEEDEEYKCHSYFEVFINRGDLSKPNDIISTMLVPYQQSDTRATITIYSTPNVGVKYIKDKEGKDTVTKIGQLVIAVPNPHNLPKSQREIEVTMDFSSTEIQAKVKYLATGKEVKVVCDFLTDIKDLH